MRCRSRIRNSTVEESEKEPILLPNKHYYSRLIVESCHGKVLHNGIRETLNLVRQKYWIPRAREWVKGVVKKCIACKKLEGLPYQTVFCPDLPKMRVDDQPPFTNTGLDFAGPLIVANRSDSNVEEKRYICLFTCMSTRAIHLELVDSLNVDSFLQAFRRFCARRGLPSVVISDNAKNFKSASKEVKRLLRSPRLGESFARKQVKWQFIVDRSPWQGGAWERLIRSVKRCLLKIVGRSMLKDAELSTILTEIECVVNSRPITYVYDDSDGVSYPLTPPHLINGRNLTQLPQEGYTEVVSTYETLSKRAKYNRLLLGRFSRRWRQEYLLGLMECYKPKNNVKELIVNCGDVVLLKDEQSKRSFWKLCKVIELIVGADGSVRSAKIQVGGSKGKIFRRPLKLLIPLEISSKDHSTSADANKDNVMNATPEQGSTQHCDSIRPRRTAALVGELLRRDTY